MQTKQTRVANVTEFFVFALLLATVGCFGWKRHRNVSFCFVNEYFSTCAIALMVLYVTQTVNIKHKHSDGALNSSTYIRTYTHTDTHPLKRDIDAEADIYSMRACALTITEKEEKTKNSRIN